MTNHYRHGKNILALGTAQALLDQAGIANILAGVNTMDDGVAVGKHSHPAHEMDPPQF